MLSLHCGRAGLRLMWSFSMQCQYCFWEYFFLIERPSVLPCFWAITLRSLRVHRSAWTLDRRGCSNKGQIAGFHPHRSDLRDFLNFLFLMLFRVLCAGLAKGFDRLMQQQKFQGNFFASMASSNWSSEANLRTYCRHFWSSSSFCYILCSAACCAWQHSSPISGFSCQADGMAWESGGGKKFCGQKPEMRPVTRTD